MPHLKLCKINEKIHFGCGAVLRCRCCHCCCCGPPKTARELRCGTLVGRKGKFSSHPIKLEIRLRGVQEHTVSSVGPVGLSAPYFIKSLLKKIQKQIFYCNILLSRFAIIKLSLWSDGGWQLLRRVAYTMINYTFSNININSYEYVRRVSVLDQQM